MAAGLTLGAACLLWALPLPTTPSRAPSSEEAIVLDALPVFPSPLEPTASFGDRALLLCWHSFLGNPAMDTDFSLHELAAQLDSLLALGYRFVDLRDLLAGRVRGRLNIVATLDDGHRTVPRAVDEVFLPRGIRPAVFVYPAIIGSVPYAMDEAAVRKLVAEGCLVGAHGYHHLFVTEKLYKSDRAEFNEEIYKAKTKTEALTGLPIMLYAYPYGAYSPITLSEVEKAGYAYGVAVKKGFVFSDSALDPSYELPRLVVTREGWKDIYDLLVRNASKL